MRRNDQVTLDEIGDDGARRTSSSRPGPGRPEDAGVSMDVIRRFGPTTPMLGVCLGHQAIGMVYGGTVTRATAPMHGKTSIGRRTTARACSPASTSPFQAGRYHSLVIADEGLPAELEVAARTQRGRHDHGACATRRYPVHGVQFHPESVLTDEGRRILRNFLDL